MEVQGTRGSLMWPGRARSSQDLGSSLASTSPSILPSCPHPLFHLSLSQPGLTMKLSRSVPESLWSSDKNRQVIALSQGCLGLQRRSGLLDSRFQAQPLPTLPRNLSLQHLL